MVSRIALPLLIVAIAIMFLIPAFAQAAPIAAVDLSVTSVVNNYHQTHNDTAVITITLANLGLATTSDATVSVPLPQGINFASAAPSVGSYDSDTGVWTIPSGFSGSEALVLNAIVDWSGYFVVTATASAGAGDSDSDSSNDLSRINFSTDTNNICYAVADNVDGTTDDYLVYYDSAVGTSSVLNLGALTFSGGAAVMDTESGTTNPFTNKLYTADGGGFSNAALYEIDILTQQAIVIDADLGVADIDGLAYDPILDTLWASTANGGTVTNGAGGANLDQLMQYALDGTLLSGPTTVTPLGGLECGVLDALTVDPVTGNLYGICSRASASCGAVAAGETTSADIIVQISTNAATFGELTEIAPVAVNGDCATSPLNDIEGIDFTLDGNLYGTMGNEVGVGTIYEDAVFELQIGTGSIVTATNQIDLDIDTANGISPSNTADFEGSGCMLTSNDLRITKTDYQSTVYPNQVVTYTLVVTNATTAIAQGVTVTDTYPTDYLTFSSATPAATVMGSNVLSWTIGEMAAGEVTTITTVFNVIDPAKDGGPVINTATVSHTPVVGGDSVPSNNDDADIDIILGSIIGDYVWYDEDGDGFQDPDEEGIPNATIVLYGSDGVTPVMTTTTDANGGYLFEGMGAGTYFVSVVAGVDGLTATDGTQTHSPATPIVIGNDEEILTVDFGYILQPAAANAVIGDTVWYDADGDGVQDAGELGIEGVLITITDGSDTYTTTTDANGNYFLEVPAGTYTIMATPPGGLTQTYDHSGALDNSTTITVLVGDQFLEADFGYNGGSLGSIGNLVWLDTDNDGIFNNGESGIAGVTVDLVDPVTGEVLATDTTDSSGNYLFTGLPADDYDVVVRDNNNVLEAFQPTVDGTPGVDGTNQVQGLTVSLGAGEAFVSADFGYIPLVADAGTIGNQLWLDTDGDGIFDPDDSEKGIPGVIVVLQNASGTPIMTTTTNSDGTYSFDSLPAGDYTVVVPNTPPGLVPTVLGTPGADNNNQGTSYAVSLSEDEIDMTGDFGFAVPASIGDFIWYDVDGDGIQDPDEGGLANVTVVLYDINGTPIFTTTTDINGSYLFDELSPGTYSVGVVAGVDGLTATSGSDVYTGGTQITVGAGENYTEADMGYQMQPTTGNAVIGDHVWVDADGDGVQDAGEAGIEGVLITITDGTNTYTTTTDASGHYLITVPTGSYTITASAPAGMTQTYDHDGTLDNSTTILLLDGDQFLGGDFGYNETTPGALLGTIGNQIWVDTNGDGDFDVDEAGIADVTVNLVDNNGAIVATVATDANGEYQFTGVPAGNYTVVVADTNGVLDEYTPTQLGTPNSDNHSQSEPYAVTLAAGDDVVSADFGYVHNGPSSNNSSVGDQVWFDSDGDGVYEPENGEYGISDVPIGLYDSNGTLVMTTTTDADGSYLFDNLVAGDYTVTILETPAGLASSPLGTANTNNQNQGTSFDVSLTPNAPNLNGDFGFTLPASIGDYVWYDADSDGVQDAPEAGLANVTVVLYDINGTPIMTTTTDAKGGYLFDNLTPGTYSVGVVAGVDGMSATSGAMVHNPATPIVVGAGENMSSADFGYVLTPAASNAVIGDTVWYDADGDGVQDDSEQGAAGIVITLTNGTNTYTTTTDSTGNYLIEVPAGSYTVTVGVPVGYDVSYDFSGLPDGTSTTTVGAGATDLNMDFGLVDTTPGTLLGSIGNQIWDDLNGDGDFDAGEPGLANVTVNLINSDTGDIVNTVTTDANGEYSFTGVPAGNYEVAVAESNGVLNGYSETVNGATVGDNNHQTGPRLITLAAGEDTTAIDFGFVQSGLTTNLASIGNQVWLDSDLDGVFDASAGDTPIAGVEIGLYRDGVLVLTTTTRADGTYLFEHLPAGNYTTQVLDSISDVNSPLYDLIAAPIPNSSSDDVNRGDSWDSSLNPNGENLLGDFAFQGPFDPTSVALGHLDAAGGQQMLLISSLLVLVVLTWGAIRPKRFDL